MEFIAALPILLLVLGAFYLLSCLIIEFQIRLAQREIAQQPENDDPVTCTSR